MTETNIDILGGHSQVNPAATQAYQYNYYGQAAPAVEPAAAPTVVVLGAGVDVAAGLPAPGSLIPRITDWLETNTGKAVDTALRKLLKGLRFRFDKFVDNTITRLSQDLDRERDAICSRVRQELEQNDRLDDGQRRMGQLIVRIFQKITDVKDGATIDEETETLIREVTGIELTEETIIDFARINYTKTFEAIIRHILQTSLHDTDHPILRHVYTHLLDIGQLLALRGTGHHCSCSGRNASGDIPSVMRQRAGAGHHLQLHLLCRHRFAHGDILQRQSGRLCGHREQERPASG